MKKTSVYLREDEVARLAELARREGVPQAEVIRRAIASYAPATSDREFALVAIAEGDGTSVLDVPEETLFEGFGG
jgi:predicted DNA-binding protein